MEFAKDALDEVKYAENSKLDCMCCVNKKSFQQQELGATYRSAQLSFNPDLHLIVLILGMLLQQTAIFHPFLIQEFHLMMVSGILMLLTLDQEFLNTIFLVERVHLNFLQEYFLDLDLMHLKF